MTEATFNRVGISTRKGKTRVRFTNSDNREIVKDGHDDITFLELPEPMTKPDAVTYLVERKADFELDDQIAIDEANDKYNIVVVSGSTANVKAPDLEEIKGRAAKATAEA